MLSGSSSAAMVVLTSCNALFKKRLLCIGLCTFASNIIRLHSLLWRRSGGAVPVEQGVWDRSRPCHDSGDLKQHDRDSFGIRKRCVNTWLDSPTLFVLPSCLAIFKEYNGNFSAKLIAVNTVASRTAGIATHSL